MVVSGEFLATIAVAILSGGFAAEVFRSWRDRKRVDLDLFYPTWKEEMARLHEEIAQLRALVLALSGEVARLGGDPVRLTYQVQLDKIEKEPDDSDA